MIIGDNNNFGFEINKKEDHNTKFKMFVDGNNILEYYYKGQTRTTKWNIDDVISFLHNDILKLIYDDPSFPFDDVKGKCAAELVSNAREFDSNSVKEFDEYYDKLYEWTHCHSWLHTIHGGYIGDVYFRVVNNCFEVSWDNRNIFNDIEYKYLTGYKTIGAVEFIRTITTLYDSYNNMWKQN